MEKFVEKKQSSICKYKKVLIDINRSPILLPGLDKVNYKFTGLLHKMKQLNHALTERKYLNRILVTPSQTRDNSIRDGNIHYEGWKSLADDNKEYKLMYKNVELQNYRIRRFKRSQHN